MPFVTIPEGLSNGRTKIMTFIGDNEIFLTFIIIFISILIFILIITIAINMAIL
ncbi:hypothetical protein [Youngiibacter fragilis]|nr:hypothetical protein [Youngiibacter fragilis]